MPANEKVMQAWLNREQDEALRAEKNTGTNSMAKAYKACVLVPLDQICSTMLCKDWRAGLKEQLQSGESKLLLPSNVAAPEIDLAELDEACTKAASGIARKLGLYTKSMLILECEGDTVGLALPLQQFAAEIPARSRQSWRK
jgi:hypothetical protein